MEWGELTSFGKGIAIGIFSWILLVVFIFVQKAYVSYNLYQMKPDIFYTFDIGLSIPQLIYVGLFLIFAMGIIGWIYGRVISEKS